MSHYTVTLSIPTRVVLQMEAENFDAAREKGLLAATWITAQVSFLPPAGRCAMPGVKLQGAAILTEDARLAEVELGVEQELFEGGKL